MVFFKKNGKELKEKNELLRENKELFRDIFDQSSMGEAVIDLNRTYVDVNQRFCEITGYSKEELLGMNMADITHPDDVKKTVDVLRDLLLEEVPFAKLEKRYVRKDGKTVWGFLNITLVYGNGNKEPQYFFGQIQDISEFKENDQQLQDLQKKYRTIVEKGNDGIVVIQDFLVKFSNSKMLEMTGYKIEDFLEKPFLSFIAPDYINLIKSNYVKRIAKEEVESNYKVEIIKKNGQRLPVEISGSIIDYEGKIADMAFIRDISQREKAEEELKRYKFIFDQSNQQIAIADLNGNFVTVNESYAKNHGYTIDELIGKNLSMVHPKEEIPIVKNSVKVLIEKGKNNGEIIQMRKDGSTYITFMDNFVLNVDSKPKYLVGMASDITKIKESEKKIVEIKERLDEAQKMAHLGYWIWDVKTGSVEWSEEVFKIFGLNPKEFVPQINSILSLSPWPEDNQRDNELIQRATKTHEPGEYEQRFLRPDKTIGYYYSTFRGKYDDNGNLITIIGTIQDITKDKEAEKNIKEQKSLVDSIIKSTNDALLVVDRTGKVSFYNDRFKNFWKIPLDIMKTKDDKKLLDYVVSQLSDAKEFLDKVNYLYLHPEEESYDVIYFKDGRVFDRYSTAQKVGNEIIGRIWNFRDVTEKTKLAEEEKKRILQIERINRLAIGRELKMVELKKEIADLKKKISNI